MTAKKQRGNNDGAVLLTVLTVACFAAILLTAVLSFVGRAHTNAYNNYNSEQAYYIASSALGSIHDYFEEADGSYTKLLEMANANSNAGTTGTLKFSDGSDTIEMSELVKDSNCTVKVSRMGDGYIKLSVTGYCRGQAETINAYYTIQEEKSSGGIDNALYSDGSSPLGNCASSNGPFTSRDSYKVTNGTEAKGTVVTGFNFDVKSAKYSWGTDSSSTAKNYIIVGHNMRVENYAKFIPETPKVPAGSTPDNTSQFIAVGGEFNLQDSIQIGSDYGNDMDLYCNSGYLNGRSSISEEFNDDGSKYATSYLQYGNLYCYKMTEDEFNKIHSEQSTDLNNHPCDCTSVDPNSNGRFIIDLSGTGMMIHGNVYIDGELNFAKSSYNAPAIIDGELYLSADTTVTYPGTMGTSYMSRMRINKLHAPGMTYEQVAKLVSDGVIRFNGTTQAWANSINSGIDDAGNPITLQAKLAPYVDQITFDNMTPTARETKPNTDFVDGGFEKLYETTEDYLARPEHAAIKNAFETACSDPARFDIKNYFVNGGYTGDDFLNNTYFDYVINHSNNGVNACVMSGLNPNGRNSQLGATIFVDLDAIDADFVIVLKNEYSNSVTFDQGGSAPSEPMIVVKNGTMDSDGNWVSGKEPKHNLYIITAKNDAGYQIKALKFGLYDYYTYKYVILENRAVNVGSSIDPNTQKQVGRKFAAESDNAYTDASGNAHGVYTPQPTRNYFMLYNEKDYLQFENSIDPRYEFVEATIYAPNSIIDIPDSYGSKGLYMLKDIGSNKVSCIDGGNGETCRVAILGAIVCAEFRSGNQFGVAFVPPSPDSGIGGSSTSGGTTIKFSHYESR